MALNEQSSVLVATILSFYILRVFYLLLTVFVSGKEIIDKNSIIYSIILYSFLALIILLRRRLPYVFGLHISRYWLYLGRTLLLFGLIYLARLFWICDIFFGQSSCRYTFPQPLVIKKIQSYHSGSYTGLSMVAMLVFSFQSLHFGWYVCFSNV